MGTTSSTAVRSSNAAQETEGSGPRTGNLRSRAFPASTVFNVADFQRTPLNRDPYDYIILNDFVLPEALRRINEDYPKIDQRGSFSLASLTFGPGFQMMIDALESEEFRKIFEEKFQMDLTGRPSTITVRKYCGTPDGKGHVDSASKIVTILLYMNPDWDNSGGRLRLLRSNNLDDFAAEVPPSGGALVAFRCSEHSWHGHLPFIGERRVIQFNWVTDQKSQRVAIFRHRVSASLKRMLAFVNPGTGKPDDSGNM